MTKQELIDLIRTNDGEKRLNLRHADLTGADLTGANLTRANLTCANLRHADLTCADLTGADLTGANLRHADLTGANLRHADLTCADLDFSSWPLWCGSLNVKVDAKIARQLAYHFCRLECDDPDFIAARNAIIGFANGFHRVDECGVLEEK
jgi:hypothetical protein